MAHAHYDHDGMDCLVIDEMQRRLDPKTGKPLPARKMAGLKIVHASEIARHYGLDLADIGFGDNRQLGVWSLVNNQLIGRRIPYNSEETTIGNHIVRDWNVLKDVTGRAYDTEEILVEKPLTLETDDGFYIALDDVLKYAKVNGWTKGGGWPAKAASAAPQVDIAAIVAAVLAALGHAPAESAVARKR